jgi:hypothetical protein
MNIHLQLDILILPDGLLDARLRMPIHYRDNHFCEDIPPPRGDHSLPPMYKPLRPMDTHGCEDIPTPSSDHSWPRMHMTIRPRDTHAHEGIAIYPGDL